MTGNWVKLTRYVADTVYGTVFWANAAHMVSLSRSLDNKKTRIRTNVTTGVTGGNVSIFEIEVVETPMQVLVMLSGEGTAS